MLMRARFGLEEVRTHEEGLFFFVFNNKYGFDKFLKDGPWKLYNQFIYLKAWTPDFDTKKDEFKQFTFGQN